MPELISRNLALTNPVFASFIKHWQSRADPRIDPYMEEPGLYHDPQLGIDRYFTKEEIDTMHQQQLEEFKLVSDNIEEILLVKHGELIYNHPTEDIQLYPCDMGNVLCELSALFDAPIIFLLDLRIPWLYQDNDFKPVASALKYLRDIGVGEDFVGGISASGEELAELTYHLFWIIRCNAALPYCWFSTPNDAFVADLCKYGNLHLHTYQAAIKSQLEDFAIHQKLIKIDDCYQQFDDSDGMEGRQTIVD